MFIYLMFVSLLLAYIEFEKAKPSGDFVFKVAFSNVAMWYSIEMSLEHSCFVVISGVDFPWR